MNTSNSKKQFSGETETILLPGEKELHEYDGIIEMDNPMPRWWVLLFYFGLVFGAMYYTYYELGSGQTIQQEFNLVKADLDSKALARADAASSFDELGYAKRASDPQFKELGKAAFLKNCASCHGALGQGLIGPNLADRFWLHGNQPQQIARVIAKGILEKGMPAWEAVLSAEESLAVVAYVKSLGGTNPPQAKEPQGVELK